MELEEALQTLRSIASRFPKESKEYQATELAAKALQYAFHDEVKRKFEVFLRDFDAELTDEQKEQLHRMGIDAGID
jgi:signal transduction histidine kinase